MLPDGFINELNNIPGLDAGSFLASLDLPRIKAIRLADAKIGLDEAAASLGALSPVPWEENAFVCPDGLNGNDPRHRAGMFYMQEPSAMLPVAAADIAGDSRILDLCASPGGKSHQLACRIDRGMLISNEIVPQRSRVLLSNTERMGIRNSAVVNTDPEKLALAFPEAFDVVLADVPCSGESLFRRDPDAALEWSPERSLGCAERDRAILQSAIKCLKIGGLLIYSTCTFSVVENEGVAAWLVREHGFSLVKPREGVIESTARGIDTDGIDMEYARRYYPYFGLGEGQFLAVLKKERPSNIDGRVKSQSSLEKPSKEEDRCARDFLKSAIGCVPGELFSYRGVISLSEHPLLSIPRGVPSLRFGTALGSVEKRRFKPHHQFFSVYGAKMLQKIELSSDSDEAARYLSGEELDPHGLSNGFAAVLIDGCAAGGVRIAGGRAKNLYPKGLRG